MGRWVEGHGEWKGHWAPAHMSLKHSQVILLLASGNEALCSLFPSSFIHPFNKQSLNARTVLSDGDTMDLMQRFLDFFTH